MLVIPLEYSGLNPTEMCERIRHFIYFLIYFLAGYEDWKSWRPACGHLFTLLSSVILKSPFKQNPMASLLSAAYKCQHRIARPAGEVIMLTWEIFHPGSNTNFVKVWDIQIWYLNSPNCNALLCFKENAFRLAPAVQHQAPNLQLSFHGPLTIYVKLRVAHALGTFLPPPTSKEIAS